MFFCFLFLVTGGSVVFFWFKNKRLTFLYYLDVFFVLSFLLFIKIGTWHDPFQVKLTSEELCQWTNRSTKQNYKFRICLGTIMRVVLNDNLLSFTWKQLWQWHLVTIVLVQPGSNRAIISWEYLWQCHLETTVLVSLEMNCGSVTWEKSDQSHLGAIVPASLGNHCANITWERSCQSNLGTPVPSHLGNIISVLTWNNCSSVT